MMEQKEALKKPLSRDSYLIVVLDACRHDDFERWVNENRENLSDDVERVRSAGHGTLKWFKNTWTDYYDAVYLSANPYINSFTHPTTGKLLAHRRFKEVVDCWKDWSEEFNTCLPETVNRMAEEYLDEDRLIVHYMQPHYPYIVEDLPDEFYRDTRFGKGGIPGNPPMKLVRAMTEEKAGEVGLRRMYRLQVDRVLRHAFKLIDEVERRAYITSDHSELMGEDGKYFHWNWYSDDERLRVVPWLEVGD